MIDRTSAPKLSSSGPRRSTGPTRLMSLAIAGSRLATRRVPFAISAGVELRGATVAVLGELRHEVGELLAIQPEIVLAEVHERSLGNALGRDEVVHFGVDVKQPGDQVALGAPFFDDVNGGTAIGGIVVFAELLEHDVGTVVQLDVTHRSGLVVDLNLLKEGDERHVRDRLLMVLYPAVALGRAVVVVECDARRDDVEDRGAAMRDRR